MSYALAAIAIIITVRSKENSRPILDSWPEYAGYCSLFCLSHFFEYSRVFSSPNADKIITGGIAMMLRRACGRPSEDIITGSNISTIQKRRNTELNLSRGSEVFLKIFFIEIIIAIRKNIPTITESSGAPEKLCRQLGSPYTQNIPIVFAAFTIKALTGEGSEKIEIWLVRPKKSAG